MLANSTAPKQITKLRGRFNAFEETNPAITDVYKFCDKITRREETYFAMPESPPERWLVSKKFDLLFVCGLAPWIFGAVAYFCTGGLVQQPIVGPNQQLLTMFLVGASFLIGESHQFTSILRYYSRTFRQRRFPYTWQRLPIWLLYFLFALAAVAIPGSTFLAFSPFVELSTMASAIFAMPVAVLAIVMVSFFPAFLMQHFCAQAKAVGLTFCNNNNFYLSQLERTALSVVSWLLVLTGVLTIAAPFAGNGMFFGTPAWIQQFVKDSAGFHSAAIMATRYAVVFFGIHFVVRGLKCNEWLPVGATLTWLNMALFTLIPTNLMVYVWLFVPVFFHASQHWAVAWSTLQREKNQARLPEYRLPTDRAHELHDFYSDFRRLVLPVQIFSVIVLFGTLIWQHLWGNSIVQSADLTLGALLSILVFYCHYFTDRVVWRPTK